MNTELANRIRTATYPERASDEDAYDRAGNFLARQFYEWLLEDPNNVTIMRNELHDAYLAIKEQGSITGEEGFTGFMVGWAASAALAMLELPPVPNPAILVIGENDEVV